MYVIDAYRTAFGACSNPDKDIIGMFEGESPRSLASKLLVEVKKWHKELFSSVDELVLGCVNDLSTESNTAQLVANDLGLHGIPGVTIHQSCLSPLYAIRDVYRAIMSGDSHLSLAGGVESSCSAGKERLDRIAKCGSTGLNMMDIDRKIADEFQITVAEMNEFVARSLQSALDSHEYVKHVVPINDYAEDQFRSADLINRVERFRIVAERTARRNPDCCKPTIYHTCKNGDGAGIAMIADQHIVDAYDLCPKAEILGFDISNIGDALRMGIAPLLSVHRLLEKTGIGFDEIDRIEQHTPFAASSLALYEADERELYGKRLGFKRAYEDGMINSAGGSVIIGHPFAVTGVRLLCNAMETRKYGLIMICGSGGLGGSMLIKRCRD